MPEFLQPVVIAGARDRVGPNRLAVYSRAYHGMIAEQAESRGAGDPPSLLRDRCPRLALGVMGAAPSAEQKPLNAHRLRVAT